MSAVAQDPPCHVRRWVTSEQFIRLLATRFLSHSPLITPFQSNGRAALVKVTTNTLRRMFTLPVTPVEQLGQVRRTRTSMKRVLGALQLRSIAAGLFEDSPHHSCFVRLRLHQTVHLLRQVLVRPTRSVPCSVAFRLPGLLLMQSHCSLHL